MLPEEVDALRALEFAELANQTHDLHAREDMRHLAACWLRLSDYAQQRRETHPDRMAA